MLSLNLLHALDFLNFPYQRQGNRKWEAQGRAQEAERAEGPEPEPELVQEWAVELVQEQERAVELARVPACCLYRLSRLRTACCFDCQQACSAPVCRLSHWQPALAAVCFVLSACKRLFYLPDTRL